MKSTGLWFFFALTLATIGLQTLVGFIAGAAMVSFVVPSPTITQELDTTAMFVAMSELIDALTTPMALIGFVALNCLAYLMGGFLCGKIATSVQYRYAAFSALAVVALNAAPFVLVDWRSGLVAVSPLGLFALLYVAMALAGTRLGSGRPFAETFHILHTPAM